MILICLNREMIIIRGSCVVGFLSGKKRLEWIALERGADRQVASIRADGFSSSFTRVVIIVVDERRKRVRWTR